MIHLTQNMKKKDIKFIIESFHKLSKQFGLDEFIEEINESTEDIYLPFPREENLLANLEFLFPYLKELDTIEVLSTNTVISETFTQRVITLSDWNKYLNILGIEIEHENHITLSIVDDPFLIGIVATKQKQYNEYHAPCSSHLAVQVKYPSKDKRLSFEDEEKLIKSFFFDLCHAYEVGFEFTTFEAKGIVFPTYDEHAYGFSVLNEEYNFGMDLFIQANQSISPELRYLSYYKIFEYFAPFYSKIEAFESMRKKLDSSKANLLSADYIASIFELAKNYEYSLRDKELVKALIDKTFDVVDIYMSLPESIIKKIKVTNLTYKSTKETKDKVINTLGTILYETTNSIVHAKSNYKSSGFECKTDDINILNSFMHMACYSTIKWYNRLPKHLKMEN